MEPILTNSKTGRNPLSIQDKLTIIKLREASVKCTVIAARFRISIPSITRIIKDKENIIECSKKMDIYHNTLKKMRLKKNDYDLTEKAVFLWYAQQRTMGYSIQTHALRAKAVEFNMKLKGPLEFTGSDGWLNKFKNCHTLLLSHPTDETPEINCYTPPTMTNYILDNVYHADETILTWKSLPQKVIDYIEKHGNDLEELLEDHVTLLTCSNVTGLHKIPLFLITETEHIKLFRKEINSPVICRSNNDAWMTKELFDSWYRTVFIPEVTQKKNGGEGPFLLLLDCTPSHWTKKYLNAIDSRVTVDYFPPNLMVNVQPFTVNIFESLKTKYREQFLQELKMKVDAGQDIISFLKSWSITDCYRTVAYAWATVPRIKLINAWHRILDFECLNEKNDNAIGEITSLLNGILKAEVVSKDDVARWLGEDSNLPCCQILTDDEIVKEVTANREMYDPVEDLVEGDEKLESDLIEETEISEKCGDEIGKGKSKKGKKRKKTKNARIQKTKEKEEEKNQETKQEKNQETKQETNQETNQEERQEERQEKQQEKHQEKKQENQSGEPEVEYMVVDEEVVENSGVTVDAGKVENHEEIVVEEIASNVNNEIVMADCEDEDIEDIPSMQEAIKGFKVFRKWSETQMEYDEDDHNYMEKLYDIAMAIQRKTLF